MQLIKKDVVQLMTAFQNKIEYMQFDAQGIISMFIITILINKML